MIPHTLQIVAHSDPDEIVHDNSHYLLCWWEICVLQGTFATWSPRLVGAEGDSYRRTMQSNDGKNLVL